MKITHRKRVIKEVNSVEEIVTFWIENGDITNFKALSSKICEKIEDFLLAKKASVTKCRKARKDFFGKFRINQKEYWLSRGWTPEEAVQKIKEVQNNFPLPDTDEYKKRCEKYTKKYWLESTGLSEKEYRKKRKNNYLSPRERFYEKYGPEEGEKFYLEWKEKIKNTKENFIRVYGVKEGKEKWKVYIEALKNRDFGKEFSKKISKITKGRKLSEEHKKRIGKSRRTPTFFGETPFNTYAPQIEWCESVRRSSKDSNVLEVKCAYCGKWYRPTVVDVKKRITALKGRLPGEQRLYCSDDCKILCPIYRQRKYYKFQEGQDSREVQPELRQLVFKRDKWTCQKCGQEGGSLQCHHIQPVALDPLESADIDNCITLCVDCHKEAHKIPGCGYGELRNCS